MSKQQPKLPAAIFVRFADWEIGPIALAGNFHVISTTDAKELPLIASRLADQLMDPSDLTAEAILPMWLDPSDAWTYGDTELLEIKRRLLTAPVVSVAMRDLGDRCAFGYELRPHNAAQAKALSDGLQGLRPTRVN